MYANEFHQQMSTAYPEFGIIMASSVLLYKQRTSLVGGHPPIPRNCPADRLRTRQVWRFSLAVSHSNKKSGQTATSRLPSAHALPILRFWFFLLLPPLFFVDLQEAIDVLLCDLVVHHVLLYAAIFLVEFSLLCKNRAILH